MTYHCEHCGASFRAIHRVVTHRQTEHPLPERTEDEVFARFERWSARA